MTLEEVKRALDSRILAFEVRDAWVQTIVMFALSQYNPLHGEVINPGVIDCQVHVPYLTCNHLSTFRLIEHLALLGDAEWSVREDLNRTALLGNTFLDFKSRARRLFVVPEANLHLFARTDGGVDEVATYDQATWDQLQQATERFRATKAVLRGPLHSE